mmetsp:Transcript_36266/g.82648  ORF Transcript_36266/g.82648 Transcript_36266/m.82648 type:complete len:540 (-) Transcript_36266:572-2191(-)
MGGARPTSSSRGVGGLTPIAKLQRSNSTSGFEAPQENVNKHPPRAQSSHGVPSATRSDNQELLRQFLSDNTNMRQSRQGVRGVLNEVRGAQFKIHALNKGEEVCERCLELRRSIKMLKLRNDDLKRSHIEIQEISLRKSMEHEETINRLVSENDRLVALLNQQGEQMQTGLADNQQAEALKKRVRVLEEELQYATDQQAQGRQEIALLKAELQRYNQLVQTKEDQWAAERSKLKGTIKDLEATLARFRSSDLEHNQSNGQLMDKLSLAHRDVETLRKQLAEQVELALRSKEGAGQTGARVAELEALLRAAETKAEDALAFAKSLQDQVSQAQADAKQAQTQLQESQRQVGLAATALDAANQAIEGLKASLDRTTQELFESSEKMSLLQTKMASLTRENEQEVNILENKLRSESKARDRVTSEKEQAERQLKDTKTELREEKHRLLEEIRALRVEMEEYKKKAETTKVVVVTPRIFITIPGGQSKEYGQMDLPPEVIRKLVVQQLGYEPGEIRSVRNLDEIQDLKLQKQRSQSSLAASSS